MHSIVALGPILPQLTVIGKELGISSVVMGSITGLLPIAYLFIKPVLGVIVDIYREYRKFIFLLLIILMTTCYTVMTVLPVYNSVKLGFYGDFSEGDLITQCNKDFQQIYSCHNGTKKFICNSNCTHEEFILYDQQNRSYCLISDIQKELQGNCHITCTEDIENYQNSCVYKSLKFWIFVVALCLGMICFNTVNSISDAICCDVVGKIKFL